MQNNNDAVPQAFPAEAEDDARVITAAEIQNDVEREDESQINILPVDSTNTTLSMSHDGEAWHHHDIGIASDEIFEAMAAMLDNIVETAVQGETNSANQNTIAETSPVDILPTLSDDDFPTNMMMREV